MCVGASKRAGVIPNVATLRKLTHAIARMLHTTGSACSRAKRQFVNNWHVDETVRRHVAARVAAAIKKVGIAYQCASSADPHIVAHAHLLHRHGCKVAIVSNDSDLRLHCLGFVSVFLVPRQCGEMRAVTRLEFLRFYRNMFKVNESCDDRLISALTHIRRITGM